MRFLGNVIDKLQRHPKRLVFPEGEEPRILQAARQFHALRLGAPIVLGDPVKIRSLAEEMSLSLEGIRIINPATSEDLENLQNDSMLCAAKRGCGQPKRARRCCSRISTGR